MTKKLVSIIVPAYNEEDNVEYCYGELKKITDTLSDSYNFEFIFTDNASTDRTFDLLEKLAEKDERIRIFSFSRNFGYQKSIHTGYNKAEGDCAIEYDCDLQDPPELLPEFLKHWKEGNQIVYGIRKTRREGKFITFLRKVFYRFINKISEHTLPEDAGDFMLIDKVIINEIKKRQDQHPYLRGMIFSFGFNQKGVPYDRNERKHGKTKFSLKKMLGLAVDGIISQSIVPLRIASYTGIIVALITVFLSGFYIVERLFFGLDWPAGWTTTVVLLLFSISLNALFLGIIGEYLLRIYNQVRNKSVTIIKKEIDRNLENK